MAHPIGVASECKSLGLVDSLKLIFHLQTVLTILKMVVDKTMKDVNESSKRKKQLTSIIPMTTEVR